MLLPWTLPRLCVCVCPWSSRMFFFFLFSLFFVRFVVAHVRLHPLVCVLLTQITSFSLFLFLSFVLCVLSSSFATEEDKSTRRKKSMSYIVLWASSIYLTAIEIHYTRHFSFSIIIIEIYIYKKYLIYVCWDWLPLYLLFVSYVRDEEEERVNFFFLFLLHIFIYIYRL